MSHTAHEIMMSLQDRAIEGFVYRKTHNPVFYDKYRDIVLDVPLSIENNMLDTGSPMIWYCDHCGWPSDIKIEDHFLSPPRTCCTECNEMRLRGWLDEAKSKAEAIV